MRLRAVGSPSAPACAWWCVLLGVLAGAGGCGGVDEGLLPPPDDGTGAMVGGDGDGTGGSAGDGDGTGGTAGDGDGTGGGAGDGDGGDGDGDGDGAGGMMGSGAMSGAGGMAGDGDVDAGTVECEVVPGSNTVPTCTRPQATTACYEGLCYIAACEDGYRDCNLDPEDGCEAAPDSLDHCGGCNEPCKLPGVEFLCVDGACESQGCAPGFGDCDGDPDNGCETDTTTTRNCGRCDNECPTPERASPACIEGVCGAGDCQPGFGDCDMELGCEQPLDSPQHCGACGALCDLPGTATATCEQDECRVATCEADVADCNGVGEDGCETDLEGTANCGDCGVVCDLPNTTAHDCEAGTCLIDHGCPNQGQGCMDDAPENGCEADFGDCDGMAGNGCEADLTRQANCGSCGVDCRDGVGDGVLTACTDGACEETGCAEGYDDCGNGCEPIDTDENCGACDNDCTMMGQFCSNGACTTLVCDPGTADCNGEVGDGCEVDTTTTSDCRGCGVMCSAGDNATPLCETNGCDYTCDMNFEDCDGEAGNGCEIELTTDDENCGACDNDCNQLSGVDVGVCGGGSCDIAMCTVGFRDCNMDTADGCEVNLGARTSCGDCDNDCTVLPNTTGHGCNMGTCTFSCTAGFSDCNGDPSDGCEADLNSATSCGGCGNNCLALENVADAMCTNDVCMISDCTQGFDDCDGSELNGCETSVQNVQSCGSCDTTCAPAGATEASCPGGECTVVSCTAGLGDCDMDGGNGCEANLMTDQTNCGTCGNDCGGSGCTNGTCGCATDADCTGEESCCGGTCIFTAGSCGWCTGGTPNTGNCGGCGKICIPFYQPYCCQ